MKHDTRLTKTACVVTKGENFPNGIIKVNGHVKEKVSLLRRIEVLEETLYKLREEISPLIKEIERIKDWVGISN